MLSRFGAQPLLLGTGLVLSALSLANVALLGLAAVPLLLLVGATVFEPPKVTAATITIDRRRLYVGQDVRVKVGVTLAPGWGPLDVSVALPPSFLVKEGSNHVHQWCNRGIKSLDWEFVVRCDKRGIQELAGVQFEGTHPTLLGATLKGRVGEPVAVRVQPRWARLRRVRTRKLRSKSPIPELDLSQTGVPTTEFEDIRQYQWGDSPRSVNWKASARAMAMSGQGRLLVNKYEREGKRIVWIYLDAGVEALVGTTLDNAFERRLETAYTLASHFLSRGFSTGFTLYDCENIISLYPDLSSKQKARILELVHNMGPTQDAATLAEAVTKAKAHMAPKKTLAFVISSLGNTTAQLEPGLRLLRNHLGHRQGRVPVVLIHINPYGLVPEAKEYALAQVTALMQRGTIRDIRKLGVFCVEWDPSRRSIASLVRRVTP